MDSIWLFLKSSVTFLLLTRFLNSLTFNVIIDTAGFFVCHFGFGFLYASSFYFLSFSFNVSFCIN